MYIYDYIYFAVEKRLRRRDYLVKITGVNTLEETWGGQGVG